MNLGPSLLVFQRPLSTASALQITNNCKPTNIITQSGTQRKISPGIIVAQALDHYINVAQPLR